MAFDTSLALSIQAARTIDVGRGNGGGSTPAVSGTSIHALEILQPQPNLDTTNRFYKAYPGFEYNVRVAVRGGGYPYTFELTNFPIGMSIDSRGVITWASPTASATPYNVTVAVTDQNNDTVSVSWTILVTTAGFLFVDAVNGTTTALGGDGSIGNPWKTTADVYGGNLYDNKWENHHPGEFVYWRAGIYEIDAYIEDAPTEPRIPWSGRKPLVWLPYPGETPEINFNTNGNTGYIHFYDNVANVYLDGFDFNMNAAPRGKGIAIDNNGNVTVRRNVFRGATVAGADNNSQLFLTGGTGQFTAIQDNTASEAVGYWLLGYKSPKTIVEDNSISSAIPLPLGPKDGIDNWTFRNNRLNVSTDLGALWLQDFGTSGDIDISFNLFNVTGAGAHALRLLSSDPSGPVQVRRNTLIGDVEIWNLTETKGPWYLDSNIIINGNTDADKLRRTGTVVESRLIQIDNLVGSPSDGIVDANGELTPAYSEFIGTRGHQLL